MLSNTGWNVFGFEPGLPGPRLSWGHGWIDPSEGDLQSRRPAHTVVGSSYLSKEFLHTASSLTWSMTSPSSPISKENVIYPDQPDFKHFNWFRIYEIARVFHAVHQSQPNRPPQHEFNFDPNWAFVHPIELRRVILESLKLKDMKMFMKVSNEISPELKHDYEESKEDLKKLNQIEHQLEYNIILNTPEESSKTLRIELCPPMICKTHALNRRYGAERFLRVSISEKLGQQIRSTYSTSSSKLIKSKTLIKEFFMRPLRIGNRVYHTFLRKEVRQKRLIP